MNNKRNVAYLFGALFVLSLFAIFAIVTITSSQDSGLAAIQTSQGMNHQDIWCSQIYRNATDTWEAPDCRVNDNTYTNAGKNATRDYLWGTAGANFDFIALGNTTSTSATSTTLGGEQGNANNLTRAQGTIYNLGQAGNVTVSFTFTANDTSFVNTTAVFNASTGGTLFAGFDLSSSVTFQSGDKLTINGTFWSA